MKWTVEAAIVLAGVLIAASILFTNRWQIAADSSNVYRLDKLTGQIDSCGADVQRAQDQRVLGQDCPIKIPSP